jgi:hypothetical protein
MQEKALFLHIPIVEIEMVDASGVKCTAPSNYAVHLIAFL